MRERSFWIAKARKLAWYRNVACWLDLSLVPVCGVAIAGAIALLVFRMLKLAAGPVWIGIPSLLLVSIMISGWRCWRRRFKTEDALTRLDDVGRLRNRLTAAQAGIGNWPQPREVRDATRWNWNRIIAPVAFSVFLLIGAAWVKVPDRPAQQHAVEPPLAWTQLENWLQTLEQSQLLQPEPLQNLREQVDGLKQQPQDNWYSQSSLEASDTLRQEAEHALNRMLDDMQKADKTLSAAAKLGADGTTPGEVKALNESLQTALRGLESGKLPLNKELLENLKKIDAGKLKQLNASQLAQMREKLKSGMRVCERCLGPSVQPGQEVSMQPGGNGGGGSPAPLTLKQGLTNLQTKQTDAVSNDDVSHAALGDMTGVEKGQHEVKKVAPKTPVAGGSIISPGQGGEAVWRDSLTPEEQQVLQRFFK